jgi:CPA2 family monovalent cation:H+ antiporter-2
LGSLIFGFLAARLRLPTILGYLLAGVAIGPNTPSVASTVVLLRALEDRGVLKSVNGRIAVGWLVVEDMAMVFTLVLLPPPRWLA